MKRLAISLASLGLLSGCATSGDYKAYLSAQAEANRQHNENAKPLVRLTAQPGMQITGLQSLEVYTPTSAPVIQQQRPNEWAAVVGQGLSVVGAVGSIYAAGKAASSLADSVGNSATAGYPYVQANGPVNTSTSTTNNTSSVENTTTNTTSTNTNTDTTSLSNSASSLQDVPGLTLSPSLTVPAK